METNPFSPPETLYTRTDAEVRQTYPEATNGKRFLNFLIDTLVDYACMWIVGFIIGFTMILNGAGETGVLALGPFFTLLGLVIWFGYYTLQEAIFGLTLGKLITGTRVVDNETHEKPALSRIMVRSLCRLIPFEAFSFFGNKPGGWHDHMSKTRTIDIRAMPISVAEYEEMRDLRI